MKSNHPTVIQQERSALDRYVDLMGRLKFNI